MRGAVLFIVVMGFFLLALPMLALDSPAPPVEMTDAEEPVFTALPPQLRQGQAQEAEDAGDAGAAVIDDGERLSAEYFDPVFPEGGEEIAFGGFGETGADEAPGAEEIPELYADFDGADSFLIYDEGLGEVKEVSVVDYVRGAVAAEMPASFHIEALRAQAVAAHTYALYNRFLHRESPDPGLMGADFAANPGERKVYMTEESAREFYGEDADVYWAKICEAADSVMDIVLTYGGEPIVAAYHAISGGMTEDAGNVWAGGAPYLLSVPSPGDGLAPGYETETVLNVSEVRELLLAGYPTLELSGGAEEWFGPAERSEAGYVTYMDVGGLDLHGKEIRELFGLRSHNFNISYDSGTESFVFAVTGYGHGVGLSQYGADYLANSGAAYEEILKTYYTGTQLARLAI